MDLQEVTLRRLGELALPVQPLARVVAYKRVLGRHADLAELEPLLARAAGD
jgi:hypothetical protein